jgi:para-aminobenzoate synthetase component 1
VLNWAKQFDTFCFLDNHGYENPPHSVECLLGVGVSRSLAANCANSVPGENSQSSDTTPVLEQLQKFIDEKKGWLFGHLNYDLKIETEKVPSGHPDGIGFPDLFFFEPLILVKFSETEMLISAEDPGKVYQEIIEFPTSENTLPAKVEIRSRLDRAAYISKLEKLKEHIHRGDCYEINFCQEFYSAECDINPVAVYKALSAASPNPFSSLYRVKDRWLICASPERYLKKTGSHIISQPIKGTLKREMSDELANRKKLYESEKDRSENVMIVDLVRNDLSRVCKENTVKVDELFGIYSFPQVYQMISTISGDLKDEIKFSDIIRASFPMGSMTGAPKKRVVELIEAYETRRRGIFSGAVGYITPGNDFDFNVVIRSIMYNAESRYLSYQAGSGITFYSEPEKEWEECMVKVKAIEEVVGGKGVGG